MATKKKGGRKITPQKKPPRAVATPSVVAPKEAVERAINPRPGRPASKKRAQRAIENATLPLMRLPAELRNQIYEYTVHPASSRIRLTYTGYTAPKTAVYPRGLYDGFNLLHTCSQMRNDFIGLYYGTTNFEIQSADLEQFSALLNATNAPSPRRLLVMSYLQRYSYLNALKFQYQHPDCEVEILPRNENVDIWEMFKDIENLGWRRLVVAGGLSGIVLSPSGKVSIAFRLNFVPTWMRQCNPSVEDHAIFSEKLGLTAGKTVDGIRIEFNCCVD